MTKTFPTDQKNKNKYKYTNTACDEMTERPNICYIFE